MADPTSPTINTLTVEALQQAGYGSQQATAGSNVQQRSEIWFEEAKSEIWKASNGKMKSLKTSQLIGITTAGTSADNEGQTMFNNPSDFAHHISMSLLKCTHSGICQAGGSSTTAKLASDEDMTAAYAIGKEIVIFTTATQTTCESSTIINFNTTTKVATFTPALPSITPGTSQTYMVVDDSEPIKEKDIWTFDKRTEVERGTPTGYHPVFDSDVNIDTINTGGQFILDPAPYFDSDSKPRAIRHRYYANLTRVDNTDSAQTNIMGYLIHNWRHEFTQYVKYKGLDSLGDMKTNDAYLLWDDMKKKLVAKENEMYDSSTLQQVVDND